MSKKIDERLPLHIGGDRLPRYSAIKTPWEKLIGYQEAVHYASRYISVVSASLLQALRILMPDYEERAQYMCKHAYDTLITHTKVGSQQFIDGHNMHPFMRGNFMGALIGDKGDEAQLMPGRVNDFGTYRAEKELDVCDWDIIGSELCRATTMSLQANADAMSEYFRDGTKIEFSMWEAKGCGDRHCRIVAESRDKYPMPERELWQSFGPIATADQIKYTPEEDCVAESMFFREECGYEFTNGTNARSVETEVMAMYGASASLYIGPIFQILIDEGRYTKEFVDHVVHCVTEAAGKAMFCEKAGIEGVRSWLGVPRSIEDGRVMGGHIEVFLMSKLCPYEVEAFNADEVIYTIDRMTLMGGAPRFLDAVLSIWNGAVKTLVNGEYAVWEEDSPEGKVRIKIAKKVDKFR